jgi:hypothetical protein
MKIEATKAPTIQDLVRRILYRKTGIILVPSRREAHPFIPTTLRELQNILEFLENLPDANPDKRNGLELFYKFFLNQWVPSNLSRDQEAVTREFVGSADIDKNKLLFKWLNSRLGEIENVENLAVGDSSAWKMIAKKASRIDLARGLQKVTLGELLALLETYEQVLLSTSAKKFIFSIKLLYSINILKALYLDDEHRIANLIGGEWRNPEYQKTFPFDIRSTIGPKANEASPADENDPPRSSISPSATIGLITSDINTPLKYLKLKYENELKGLDVALDERNAEKRLLAVCSFLYFGKADERLRDNPFRNWFDVKIAAGIGYTSNAEIDSWAFLYWRLTPLSNEIRIWGDQTIDNLNLGNRQKYFPFFQIEVIESAFEIARTGDVNLRKKKLRDETRDWSAEFAVDCFIDAAKEVARNLEPDEVLASSLGKLEMFALSQENWNAVMDTIRNLELEFGFPKSRKSSKDDRTVQSKPAHTPPKKPIEHYLNSFKAYSTSAKEGDFIRDRITKFSNDYSEVLSDSQKNELKRMQGQIWKNRHDLRFRATQAERVLEMIREIRESKSVGN